MKKSQTPPSRVIVFTQPKGGTGATSICAALAEACTISNKRTLIWDLNIETRDLCRALIVNGSEAGLVTKLVNGTTELTEATLAAALISVNIDVSVLMPPDSMSEATDLVCHADGMAICERVLELSRAMYDVILIDVGRRIGPATGALIRAADDVLVVIDDTVLGLTALDLFMYWLKTLVVAPERIAFVVNGYSGSLLAVPQIQAELEPVHGLGTRPWRLPPVPVDPKASLWPGSGRTLLSMGAKETRRSIMEIAKVLGIISEFSPSGSDPNDDPFSGAPAFAGMARELRPKNVR